MLTSPLVWSPGSGISKYIGARWKQGPFGPPQTIPAPLVSTSRCSTFSLHLLPGTRAADVAGIRRRLWQEAGRGRANACGFGRSAWARSSPVPRCPKQRGACLLPRSVHGRGHDANNPSQPQHRLWGPPLPRRPGLGWSCSFSSV